MRLLLFISLTSIVGAGVLYFYRKDPRYLHFIGLVIKFTIVLLLGVLILFALQRILVV